MDENENNITSPDNAVADAPVKRKPGRPKGAKNKPKENKIVRIDQRQHKVYEVQADGTEVTYFVPEPPADTADITKPGDNSRFLKYAMESLRLPKIDTSDPEQVRARVREYFDFCVERDRKPNMVGMANWLGVSHQTLLNWKRGEKRENNAPIINQALAILEELWVDYMQNGKINPASGIFLGINMFGYRNQQDIVVSPNNPLDNLDDAQARQRLLDGIALDDDEMNVE